MSHEIYINLNGKASIAYVNETPWHGLGQQLSKGASIDTWVREAGMDYEIRSAALTFATDDALTQNYPNRVALYRGDNGAPLGIVSPDYKVVQPREVLEFFRDLAEEQGWEMETAGVLFKGQKYWALARTGEESRVGTSSSKDIMKGYVLLATACDGTLATTAKHTSVRVVCNNTLTAAVGKGTPEIKVYHSTSFEPSKVKGQLGIGNGYWSGFMDQVQALSSTHLEDQVALEILKETFKPDLVPEKDLAQELLSYKAPATIWSLYKGQGRGSSLKSAKDTAWGLLNATTEYVDHLAGDGQDRRLQQAWFKKGDTIKTETFNRLMATV